MRLRKEYTAHTREAQKPQLHAFGPQAIQIVAHGKLRHGKAQKISPRQQAQIGGMQTKFRHQLRRQGRRDGANEGGNKVSVGKHPKNHGAAPHA